MDVTLMRNAMIAPPLCYSMRRHAAADNCVSHAQFFTSLPPPILLISTPSPTKPGRAVQYTVILRGLAYEKDVYQLSWGESAHL